MKVTVTIVDEIGFSFQDSQTVLKALQFHADLVAKAWNLDPVTFGWHSNKNGTDLPDSPDWKVYLTERNRKVGAKGYHTKNANGTPIAYCSFKMVAGNLYGRFHRALVTARGKVFGTNKFLSEGLLGVMAHEIAEMLCDEHIDTYSEVDPKLKGSWLVEVADPVSGGFLRFIDPAQPLVDCVLPDVVTPAFYKAKGVAPFSLAHTVTSPFTLAVPHGYAYFKDSLGKLQPVPKS